MALVSMTVPILLVILVHVHMVSTVHNVNMIIDLVNLAPVGITVDYTERKIKMMHLIVGTCNETSNTTFLCQCAAGWTDSHCETKINYCENVTCLNNGVCKPLLLNYTCLCLGTSYSGRHCEITANGMIIRKTVCRSISYVAIIVMLSFVIFIVTMDVSKYCFHIDPVGTPDQKPPKPKRKKDKRKNKPVIAISYIYVNTPSQESPTETNTTLEETAV